MKLPFPKIKELNDREKVNLRNKTLIFVGLTVILSLFFPKGKSFVYNYQVGDITTKEIVAKFNFPILKDSEKFQEDIEEALRSEPYLFIRNQDIVSEQVEKIQTFISDSEDISRHRKKYNESKVMLFRYRYETEFEKVKSQASRDSLSLSESETAFKEKYPFDLSLPSWDLFLNQKQINGEIIDYTQFEETIKNICRDRWGEGILDITKSDIISEQIQVKFGDVPELMEIQDFNDLEEAWTKARLDITQTYPDAEDILREIGYSIIVEFMKPNVTFDKETTERHQQDKTNKVPRYQGIIMENERIVDANTRITPDIHQRLESYRHALEIEEKRETGFAVVLPWIGRLILVGIILSFFFSFLKTYRSSLFDDNRIILLFSSIFILLVAVSYLFVFTFKLSAYLIPITVAAMVLTILFDARISVMAAVTLAVFISFIIGNKLEFVVVAMFTSVTSVYAVRNLRTRTQLYYAILYIVIAGILTLTSFGILKRSDWMILRLEFLSITISGILAPFITFGLSALFESLFGVTSDLTLLEHSDFNHPLLRRLSQEANGTFNHSVVVGNLAESAANAIGANALLCRVGAYYHDIGKMERPEYFIENQFHDENKHDSISPSLSARIIVNHVKEGLKLAKEYRLPAVIRDFIPMHHGTSRIEFFYKKALENLSDLDSGINESDFRYTGPKPNTKETGIVMICETVEAAVRSIKKPTLSKIETMVDKIIRNRLDMGQLDECPLTMNELTKIKGNVQGRFGLLPVLKGIYHIRIEYPSDTTPTVKSASSTAE